MRVGGIEWLRHWHAVVVTAGILSSIDKEETAWKDVGGDFASHVFYGGNNSMMERSFQHLPQYLRPCFLYFGVFCENEHIIVEVLDCRRIRR